MTRHANTHPIFRELLESIAPAPVQATSPCDDCDGTGLEPRVEWVSGCERDFEGPCCTCDGTGQLPDDEELPETLPIVRVPNPPRADTGD